MSIGYATVQDGVPVHDNVPSRVAFYRLHTDYEYPVPVAGRVMVIQQRAGRYVNAYARLLPPEETSSS
ncbi:MAG: hypothetical protein M3198_03765 [Actinomycetota bacterium]|nr:hypothetical protein [Actinomycetota bacterium]